MKTALPLPKICLVGSSMAVVTRGGVTLYSVISARINFRASAFSGLFITDQWWVHSSMAVVTRGGVTLYSVTMIALTAAEAQTLTDRPVTSRDEIVHAPLLQKYS